MWNNGLANDIAQQNIDEKLVWANEQLVARMAAGGKPAIVGSAVRRWVGKFLVTVGERLQGPMMDGGNARPVGI